MKLMSHDSITLHNNPHCLKSIKSTFHIFSCHPLVFESPKCDKKNVEPFETLFRFLPFFCFLLINNVCYAPSRLGPRKMIVSVTAVSGSFNTLNIDLFDRIFWLACLAQISQIQLRAATLMLPSSQSCRHQHTEYGF